MNQMTDLPVAFEPKRLGPYYERTSRLRVEGTRILLRAMAEVGARRLVYQSIAFMYALQGAWTLDESAPLALDAPEPFGSTVRATRQGERLALETPGIEGVVLRYGQLYGPGTYYSHDGHFGRTARKRQLAVVGKGEGTFSFLHVDDAASSALCALERGGGVYNVADDEPAAMRDWVPVFCRAVGAPRPWRVPEWVARLVAGSLVAETATRSRGASNVLARSELGWEPRWPTWREGFAQGLS